ncbi:MAG: peptidoglycan-binding protein [Acidobacteria bacterium]|nr:peptidoglycan-binding protein [Acidobacteriota bacterium]MBI3422179.1 peptidoglycan-binding protein [Acidobacteriota bacterium]
MRTVTTFGLSLALCAGLTLMAAAQTGQTQATDTTSATQSQAAAAPLEAVNLVITNKEVSAVQAALLGRGYLQARPSGVLNGQTREALRAWQTDHKLEVSGRIDRPTLESLEVSYPATGKETESARRNGMLPSLGYKTKNGALTAKNAVTGTSQSVDNHTKAGYQKTVDTTKNAGLYVKDKTVGAALYTKDKTVGAARYSKDKTVGAFTRTKNVTVSAGQTTSGGVKTAARKTQGAAQRTTDAVVGRSDLDIQTQIRAVLEGDSEARNFTTTVKNGNVTVKLPPGYQQDYSNAIASIRRVGGVKSVFVVQP